MEPTPHELEPDAASPRTYGQDVREHLAMTENKREVNGS